MLRTNRRAAPARQHGCAAAASHIAIKMACEKQTEVDEYRIGMGEVDEYTVRRANGSDRHGLRNNEAKVVRTTEFVS